MKALFAFFILAASLAFADQAKDQFKLIHVNDLNKLLADKTANVHIYDANNEKTRSKEGTIPGAVILTSYDKYDTATVLPKEKDAALVFYCANTKCSASHDAAKLAIDAGYTNVNVMADGIAGWKKSGQKATPYKKGS